jgi:hypothetical protein
MKAFAQWSGSTKWLVRFALTLGLATIAHAILTYIAMRNVDAIPESFRPATFFLLLWPELCLHGIYRGFFDPWLAPQYQPLAILRNSLCWATGVVVTLMICKCLLATSNEAPPQTDEACAPRREYKRLRLSQ